MLGNPVATTKITLFVSPGWYGGESTITQIQENSTNNLAITPDLKDILKINNNGTTEQMNANTLEISSDLTLFGSIQITGDASVRKLAATEKISTGLLTLDGGNNSINTLAAPLLLQNKAGAGDIEVFGGKLVMMTDGSIKVQERIEAKELVAESFKVRGSTTEEILGYQNAEITTNNANGTEEHLDNGTIGEGIISAGKTTTTINNPNVTTNSKIFLTPTSNTGGQTLVVKNKQDGIFTVSVELPNAKNISFDYWVIGVE